MVFDRKKKGERPPHTGESRGQGREPTSRGRYEGQAARGTKGDAPLRETRWRNCGAVRYLGGAYIRFCETNPPFFGEIHDVTLVSYVGCGEKSLKNSVGSFWKTNPISRGFWWVRWRESSILAAFSTRFTTFADVTEDKAPYRLAAVRRCPLGFAFGDQFVELLHLVRSEEHTSELQSPMYLVCRLLLEKKKN